MKKELINKEFIEVVNLIRRAKYEALKSVNKELIGLYWNVGKYISNKIDKAEWGLQVVDGLAEYIRLKHPEFKGFNRRNLYRMKQFYETYKDNEKLAPVVRELSWTHNLLILSKTKSLEEKEFYLNLSIKERYSKRELERQIDSCFYERTMLSEKVSTVWSQTNTKLSAVQRQKPIVSPLVTQLPQDITKAFKDTYILEFLDLPNEFSEKDL